MVFKQQHGFIHKANTIFLIDRFALDECNGCYM